MPVSAASFLRSLRAPVAGVPPGASAAGAAGCCDQGSAGVLSGGTDTDGLPSVRAGSAGDAAVGLLPVAASKGSAGGAAKASAGAEGLVGVSIQGSDDAAGVPQGSWSVGLEGLTMGWLPGAATKGSAGAEAPAQGSSELSATSIIAPSRLLLAGWAAPDGGRVDGVWQPRDWV